jgi:hypothetical protein
MHRPSSLTKKISLGALDASLFAGSGTVKTSADLTSAYGAGSSE